MFTDFIQASKVDGCKIIPPTIDKMPISRGEYKEIEAKFLNAGGNWSTSERAFVFPYNAESIYGNFTNGVFPDFRKLQLFPTDVNLVGSMFTFCEECGIDWRNYINGRILEPGCGTGNIIKHVFTKGARNINYCEIVPEFEEIALREFARLGIMANNVGQDFMELPTSEKFDLIVANPPFNKDRQHIKKMSEHLVSGGLLITLAGEGFYDRQEVFLNNTFKYWEMRQLLTNKKDPDTWLFENTFSGCTMLVAII